MHTYFTQSVTYDFKNLSANFNFAIVSDRSGGTRHGIFNEAVLKLNDLNPSFVMSIGDLIDTRDLKLYTTYNEDVVINERWSEFNGIVNQFKIPFFYTVGNNDIRNEKWKTFWTEQFGPTYYSFRYKDYLFMVLDSEDSPDNGNSYYAHSTTGGSSSLAGIEQGKFDHIMWAQ